MATSTSTDIAMLPPLRTDVLIGASPADTRPVPPPHEPSWLPVVMALVLLLWAFNWRRGKPGLIRAIVRQLRR